MKAFVFRLQTSLNVSQRWEQMAREDLQACLAEKDRLQKQLALVQNKIQRLEEYIRKSSSSNNLSPDVLIYREYLPVLHNRCRKLQIEIDRADEAVEKARTQFLEKRKETRSLENLREKDWQEYLHELGLEEQKLIDEVAVNTYYRRSRGNADQDMNMDQAEIFEEQSSKPELW